MGGCGAERTDIRLSLFPTTWALVIGTIMSAIAWTYLVRAFARSFGIVNVPNPIIPQHVEPTAYLGGVGIGLALLSALIGSMLFGWRPSPELVGVFWPAALFLVLGLYDDLRPLSAPGKLAGQFLLASLAVALGVRADWSGVEALDAALCVFWIVVVVNAVNVTDVCDGLVGSLTLTSFLGLAVAGGLFEPSLVIGSACFGFLVWNRPPASIFLGDAGSHLLGFLLAVAGILGFGEGAQSLGLRAPLIAIGIAVVPLFELVFLTLIRIEKGLAWWKGSPDHFALRLQGQGYTRMQTNLFACAVAILGILTATELAEVDSTAGWAWLAGLFLIALSAGWQLRRWDVPPQSP